LLDALLQGVNLGFGRCQFLLQLGGQVSGVLLGLFGIGNGGVPSANSFLTSSRVSCFSLRALTCVSITASRRFTSLLIAAICLSMLFAYYQKTWTFFLYVRP